mmetsp:Transcript_30141/g.40852  ORF Transcript_30141/g.40852 Transcript_30141/m.40852 type:complete len:311 (+) Transcript_30141:205-1137(+)
MGHCPRWGTLGWAEGGGGTRARHGPLGEGPPLSKQALASAPPAHGRCELAARLLGPGRALRASLDIARGQLNVPLFAHHQRREVGLLLVCPGSNGAERQAQPQERRHHPGQHQRQQQAEGPRGARHHDALKPRKPASLRPLLLLRGRLRTLQARDRDRGGMRLLGRLLIRGLLVILGRVLEAHVPQHCLAAGVSVDAVSVLALRLLAQVLAEAPEPEAVGIRVRGSRRRDRGRRLRRRGRGHCGLRRRPLLLGLLVHLAVQLMHLLVGNHHCRRSVQSALHFLYDAAVLERPRAIWQAAGQACGSRAWKA